MVVGEYGYLSFMSVEEVCISIHSLSLVTQFHCKNTTLKQH